MNHIFAEIFMTYFEKVSNRFKSFSNPKQKRILLTFLGLFIAYFLALLWLNLSKIHKADNQKMLELAKNLGNVTQANVEKLQGYQKKSADSLQKFKFLIKQIKTKDSLNHLKQ